MSIKDLIVATIQDGDNMLFQNEFGTIKAALDSGLDEISRMLVKNTMDLFNIISLGP